MQHGTPIDLKADGCDDTLEAWRMPRSSSVRNILAYSAGVRMVPTEILGPRTILMN